MLKAHQPTKNERRPDKEQVLCKTLDRACLSLFRNKIEHFKSRHLLSAIALPALTPRLRENLMGKAPLRLVAQRRETVQFLPSGWKTKYFIETLECGHEQHSFLNSVSEITPSAMRRRCQECKAISMSVADASLSAAAPLPGSEAPDSRNGQNRIACKPEWIAGDSLPPRKPVQSVTRKRRAA